MFDINLLPDAEDDHHEYKSGRIPAVNLKSDIEKAASAFWNSGGGVLIVGVDSRGRPDGGFSPMIGRQSVRDWIAQIVHLVEPSGKYELCVIERADLPEQNLNENNVVVVVQFEASHLVPHMAPDGRYYLRAGAHTVPARNFIVESLWAKRRIHQPKLLHALYLKPGDENVLQLCIFNVSPEPALNTLLELDPLPKIWEHSISPFPLSIPVIDQHTPFMMDIVVWANAEKHIGVDVLVRLKYQDITNREYIYEHPLYIRSYSPWRIGNDNLSELVKILKKISDSLDTLISKPRASKT